MAPPAPAAHATRLGASPPGGDRFRGVREAERDARLSPRLSVRLRSQSEPCPAAGGAAGGSGAEAAVQAADRAVRGVPAEDGVRVAVRIIHAVNDYHSCHE